MPQCPRLGFDQGAFPADDDGRRYDYGISATVGDVWLDRINPGQSAETALAYDVAEDTEITHMLVNGETLFDDGVRVDLD